MSTYQLIANAPRQAPEANRFNVEQGEAFNILDYADFAGIDLDEHVLLGRDTIQTAINKLGTTQCMVVTHALVD